MKKSINPAVAAVVIIVVLLVAAFAVYKFVIAKGKPAGEAGAKSSVAPVPADMGSGAGMGPQGTAGTDAATAPPVEGGGGAMGDQPK